ncbi:MAG: DUF1963 domain-containing protein [Hyphomonadaceae bacterium]
MDMPYNAEPEEPEFAKKRRTRLIIQRAPTPIPNDPSLSYFGGLPRLPPHLAWPSLARRAEDGAGEGPIAPTFIAQIDVSDLPLWIGRDEFPPAGTIYVFCNTQFVDVGDPGCVVLYHAGCSANFPECSPPDNLMRIGGDYDGIRKGWLTSREAGVDFKYAMHFEVFPAVRSEPEESELDWLSALYVFAHHRELVSRWPRTPDFVNTFRASLIAAVEQTKFDYSGDAWPGYAELAALAADFPPCDGEAYSNLPSAESVRFRGALAALVEGVKAKANRAPRFYGRTSIGRLLDESSLHCAASGFARGVFDANADGGQLRASMEVIANKWRQWNWPHQLLGAGTVVQDAPYDHADEALLLQISGVDVLAGSCSDGMLQFWMPPDDLKRGKFENVVATLECS